MALSLTLTAYVEENKSDLYMRPIVGSRIFDLIDVRQGIKSGDAIPNLESTAPAQAGSACGFTTSGTTSITQTVLNTTSIKVQEELCLQTLEDYFTQKYLPAGSKPETVSIEAEIIGRKIAQIAKKVGQMVMQGKTTYTNDTYLKQLNGYLALIDTAGTAVATNTTNITSITTANVLGIVQKIIHEDMPMAVTTMGDQVVLMGVDTFRLLVQALFTANMYHVAPNGGEWKANEMIFPGTDVRVIGLYELNAANTVDGGGSLPTAVKNRIIAGSLSNFVAGFDVKEDMSDFDVWYSKDNQTLRFSLRFRIGVVIRNIDELVQYTNA